MKLYFAVKHANGHSNTGSYLAHDGTYIVQPQSDKDWEKVGTFNADFVPPKLSEAFVWVRLPA